MRAISGVNSTLLAPRPSATAPTSSTAVLVMAHALTLTQLLNGTTAAITMVYIMSTTAPVHASLVRASAGQARRADKPLITYQRRQLRTKVVHVKEAAMARQSNARA